MTLNSYLSRLCDFNRDAVIVGSIGNISKELKDIPHDNKILIKGAMGAAIAFGVGYAMNTNKQVIVVIGEGSFLMRMGSMATALKHNPKNLRIIILNNGCYASCGGQKNYFDAIKNLIPRGMFEICDIQA